MAGREGGVVVVVGSGAASGSKETQHRVRGASAALTGTNFPGGGARTLTAGAASVHKTHLPESLQILHQSSISPLPPPPPSDCLDSICSANTAVAPGWRLMSASATVGG